MTMLRKCRLAILALALFPATTAALAQTVPAPPAGNIDDRIRQQVRPPSEREQADALMSGDTDIILLRRTQLFNLHGSVDVTATSNAYLATVAPVSDQFVQAQIGVGFATRIGGKVDVFADVGIAGVRYFDEASLDYSALSGVIGLGTSLGRVNVSATYQPSLVYSRDFGTRQLTSHRLRLSAALPFRLRGFTVQPEIHGERAITRPSDFAAWSGGGSLTLSHPLSRTKPIFAYATVGYDRREFDDYFTAFLGVKRKDDSLGAGAGIVWRPKSWGEVRASYSFGRNWSTSDVNGYTAHSGTLGLSATLRF